MKIPRGGAVHIVPWESWSSLTLWPKWRLLELSLDLFSLTRLATLRVGSELILLNQIETYSSLSKLVPYIRSSLTKSALRSIPRTGISLLNWTSLTCIPGILFEDSCVPCMWTCQRKIFQYSTSAHIWARCEYTNALLSSIILSRMHVIPCQRYTICPYLPCPHYLYKGMCFN